MNLRRTFLASLVILACAALVLAGGTVFWTVNKLTDIEHGDAINVSVAGEGRVTLAPQYDLVYDTHEAYIWSMAADTKGTIYLGTGHDGKIFKVTPDGNGSLLADTKQLDVTALAVDAQDRLYAGTSPDGKVYRVSPSGELSVFFDPGDKYIWSMVFDRSGNLFVGTGDKGKIYKVDPAGTSSLLIDTDESNIVSLAFASDSTLLAGTDPSGLVLRVSPSGKAFALFDSPMKEIHSILPAPDGSLYALGIADSSAHAATPQPSSAGSVPSSATVIHLSTSGEQEEISAGTSSDAQTSTETFKSAVYYIAPDGQSDLVWASEAGVAFSLLDSGRGDVLAGTGDKGRIFSVNRSHQTTLLLQSTEEQTSVLVRSKNIIYAASSNLGKLFKMDGSLATGGTLTSPVRDARFVATWGKISWKGTGVVVQTRSGNTETPDSTWSDWSAEAANAQGSPVASPPARFVQWRATLKRDSGAAPFLDSVTLAYLPRNVAPTITSLSVLPSGVGLQEQPQQPIDPGILSSGLNPSLFGFATSIPPRKVFQKGARSLQWSATDGNGDDLIYSVYYRGVAETTWHPLVTNLRSNYYTVDADALADGTYVFKIVASDLPNNPADRTLSGERTTDPVEIDNTPPELAPDPAKIDGRKVTVSFTARDALSTIQRTEFSIDGGAWQLLFPDEGISDSRAEHYRLSVELSSDGEHTIALRTVDQNLNVGSAKVVVKVEARTTKPRG